MLSRLLSPLKLFPLFVLSLQYFHAFFTCSDSLVNHPLSHPYPQPPSIQVLTTHVCTTPNTEHLPPTTIFGLCSGPLVPVLYHLLSLPPPVIVNGAGTEMHSRRFPVFVSSSTTDAPVMCRKHHQFHLNQRCSRASWPHTSARARPGFVLYIRWACCSSLASNRKALFQNTFSSSSMQSYRSWCRSVESKFQVDVVLIALIAASD